MKLGNVKIYRVNCRVGSLEIPANLEALTAHVNCRVGSLEISPLLSIKTFQVNCRVGSLETPYHLAE